MTETGRAPVGSEARRARAGRILDAAAELLSQHGYRRVSIDDVAALARVGKGTIYLHWKTREGLFWAALQRDAMRMLDDLVRRLDEDPGLAVPHRLMPAIFLEVVRRPLVKARAAGRRPGARRAHRGRLGRRGPARAGGQPRLPRSCWTGTGCCGPACPPCAAGHILSSVLRGFFFDQDEDAQPGGARELSASERADLLADVLARTLEPDAPAPEASVTALGAEVTELFRGITAVQRAQLERAY